MDAMRDVLDKYFKHKQEQKELIPAATIENMIEVFENNISKLTKTNTRTDKVKIRTLEYCINQLKTMIA